jgi:hypothetical protein
MAPFVPYAAWALHIYLWPVSLSRENNGKPWNTYKTCKMCECNMPWCPDKWSFYVILSFFSSQGIIEKKTLCCDAKF